MGAVRGVDSLQGVDGHLVEAHVDFLCFLNDNRFRRHAEEDGVLKKDLFCFVKLSHYKYSLLVYSGCLFKNIFIHSVKAKGVNTD